MEFKCLLVLAILQLASPMPETHSHVHVQAAPAEEAAPVQEVAPAVEAAPAEEEAPAEEAVPAEETAPIQEEDSITEAAEATTDAPIEEDEIQQCVETHGCGCHLRVFYGCKITNRAPPNCACSCSDEVAGCSGTVVACKDPGSYWCVHPSTNKQSCEQAPDGNCSGY